MSAAKTFQLTASDDAMQYIVTAVLARLLTDRSAKRVPGDEYDKFLTEQIAVGHEAVAALNCTSGLTREDTHGALEGRNLSTAIMALHFMLHSLKHGPFANVSDVLAGQVIASPDALNAALLFLENPK